MNIIEKIFFQITRCSVQHPKTTLIITTLLTFLSIIFISQKLQFKTSNLDLIDHRIPEIQRFLEFSTTFGTPNMLIAVFEGKNEKHMQSLINQAGPLFEKSIGVRSVIYCNPLPKNLLEELDLNEYIRSENRQSYYIFIQPQDMYSSATAIEPMVKGIRKIIQQLPSKERHVTIGLTGIPAYALDDKEFIQHDIQKLSFLSLGLILLLFIIGFRTLLRPFLAVLTLLISALLTLGATSIFPGHLTLLSASFASILFGLGIDFGIHYIRRYEETQDLPLTSQKLSRSLLTGALTTALVFYSMRFSGLKGFAELGLIAGNGMLICLLCMITLLPALLRLSKTRSMSQPQTSNKIVSTRPSFGWIIAPAQLLLLLAITAFFFPRPSFDSNYLNLQPKHSNAARLEREMTRHSNLSPQFATFHLPSEEKAAALADELLGEELIGDVRTLAGLEDLGLKQDDLVNIPQSIRQQFISSNNHYAVYAYPAQNVWNPSHQKTFVERMQQFDPHVTGMPIIGEYMLRQSEKSLKTISFLALLIITFCLYFDFRNWRLALLAMLPTLMTFTLMRFVMHIFGLTYNPINIMALPVIFGIAVDDGVHFIHRYLHEKGNLSSTFKGSGKSIILTSLTSFLGFGVLSLASHRGLASFGFLLAMGVLIALLATLLTLPWLLKIVQPDIQRRRQK